MEMAARKETVVCKYIADEQFLSIKYDPKVSSFLQFF